MNWDAIGAVAELVGATAVVFSLIYLATQIKDSKRSDQIIASASLSSTASEWLMHIVNDEGLCELYHRGVGDYDSLDKSEKSRFSLLLYQLLRNAEAGWILANSGLVDHSYWIGVENAVGLIIGCKGGRRALEKHRQYLGPEYLVFIEELLADQIEQNAD
jgi:hypothetical protein